MLCGSKVWHVYFCIDSEQVIAPVDDAIQVSLMIGRINLSAAMQHLCAMFQVRE